MRPSFPSKKSKLAVPITAQLLKSWPLPGLDEDGDKEMRGRVLVIAGSEQMPGAAVLAATASLRAGAGKLQIAAPKSAAPWIALAVPEALVLALPETRKGISPAASAQLLRPFVARADAVLMGPGMQNSKTLVTLVRSLIPDLAKKTLILDAEALECAEKLQKQFERSHVEVIITPHAGEMAKLLRTEKEQVQKTPAVHASKYANESKIVTALKGSETFIADSKGALYCNRAGNVGLGVSGSGDTLAGMIAGLAARGASAVQAAVWGVHLHACAGDLLAKRLGTLGYLPREIPIEIPALMEKFSGPRGPKKS